MEFQTKQQIRKQVIDKRLRLSTDEVRERSSKVIANLTGSGVLEGRSLCALYAAAKGEVDTRPLFDLLRSEGKTVVLPRVRGKGPDIDFYRVEDWNVLQPSRLGIPEPPPDNEPVDPASFDVVVVPAVAFDKNGGRVGYGMGCYDRVLFKTGRDCPRIGIGYDFQLFSKVPMHEHDIPLTGVITESETIFPENREAVII